MALRFLNSGYFAGKVGIGTAVTNGVLSVEGTGAAGVPVLDIINTTASTFNHSAEIMTPNMTTGQNNILVIGRVGSTKNSGYIGYKYLGTEASNDNLLTFGHWGSDNLMNIDGLGNVGIGTESPSQKLEVAGTVLIQEGTEQLYIGTNNSTGYIQYTDSAFPNDEQFYINVSGTKFIEFSKGTSSSTGLGDAVEIQNVDLSVGYDNLFVDNGTGNVGIGTISPDALLEIIDTSNPGATSGSVIIEGRRDGSPNVLTLRAKDASAPADALPNGQGPVLRFQGFDGTDFENMGYIQVAANGQAVADGDAPSFMAFGTSADSSSSPSERMRIDSAGKVSVGSPVVGQLGVRGTTNDSTAYSFESANLSGNTLFAVRNDGLSFFPSGNVGIGTPSPLSILTVGSSGGQSRAAIYGEAYGAAGVFDQGIRGEGSAYGVLGISTGAGVGVYGESSSGHGGYFTSSTGYGLLVANGNVGIGVTGPLAKLHVADSGCDIISESTSVGQATRLRLKTTTREYRVGSQNDNFWIYDSVAADYRLRIDSAGAIKFNAYGAGTLVTDSSGNITAEGGAWDGPYLPLAGTSVSGNVTGAVVSTSQIQANSFYDGHITWSAAQLNRYGAAIELQYVPTNSSTFVKIGGGGSNPTTFNAYTGEAIFTGNVGIGTTTPTQKLEVNGVIESPYLEYKPFVFYDFNSDTVSQWGVGNATLSTPSKSVTRFTTTGTDANLNRNFNGSGYNSPAIPGGQNQIIRIRYKWISGTAGSGEIFYATSGHNYDGGYYKSYDLNTDGEYHTLVLDMSNLNSGGTDWIDNDITAIRFDLINITPVVIDIDWIAVGGNGWGTQYFENDVAFMNGDVGIGTTSPLNKTHIVGPTLTRGTETSYGLAVSDIGDQTKTLLLGYDLVNDVGIIEAIDHQTAWKNLALGISGDTKVGVGEIAPTAKLHIKSPGNATLIRAYSAGYKAMDLWGATNGSQLTLHGGAEAATIVLDGRPGYDSYFATGNVGIGVTGPATKLHVSSSENANWTTTFQNTLTSDSHTVYTAYNNSSSNLRYGVYISGAGTTASDYHLLVNDQFAVVGSGNVGIGTTSPDAKLEVADSTPTIRLTNTDTSLGIDQVIGDIDFYQSDPSGDGVGVVSKIRSVNENTFAGQAGLSFHTGTNTTLTERMRISSAGAIKFNAYDSTNNTGAPTYLLGTDASGNVVKTLPQGSGTAGPYLPLTGGTMTGDIQMSANSVKFDQSGTRSWDISPGSGNLNITSGDSAGLVFLSPGISVEDNAYIGGNVGIGVTGVGAKLHIYGAGSSPNSQTDVMAIIQNSTYGSGDTAGENKLIFGWNNHYAASISAYKDGTVNRTGFKFYTEVGYNVPVEAMRITSAGDVTITGDLNISAGKKLQYSANSFMTPENNVSGAEISTAGTFIVKTGTTPTLALTLDASQNATFAGNVKINTGAVAANPRLYFQQDNIDVNNFIEVDRGSGAMEFWNNGSERMRIDSSGNVGINITNPQAKLDIVSTSVGTAINNTSTQAIFGGKQSNYSNLYIQDYRTSAGNDWTSSSKRIQMRIDSTYMAWMQFNGTGNNGGISFGTGTSTTQANVTEKIKILSSGATTFTSTVTATNFILSSDERLKENIEKVCDNRIKADWKTFELKTEKGQKRYGVIAQELEKTNPEFVREDTQGFKSVAYIDLLIAKIAELEARLEKAGI